MAVTGQFAVAANNRSKPLWEIYLVSGLSEGRQAM
jgi:Wax ester synthase/diacylglycerol acyltransferase catalytic domain